MECKLVKEVEILRRPHLEMFDSTGKVIVYELEIKKKNQP